MAAQSPALSGIEEHVLKLRTLREQLEPTIHGGNAKCYVAGPMRGVPFFNYPEFHRAAGLLRSAGWHVYNPGENDSGVVQELNLVPTDDGTPLNIPLRLFLKQDLWQVCDSEAIFVLPGWERSTGAGIETWVAAELGILICTFEEVTPVDRDDALLAANV